jgi:hypothetical protein
VGPDRHPVEWVGKYHPHQLYRSARWVLSDWHYVPPGPILFFCKSKRYVTIAVIIQVYSTTDERKEDVPHAFR